MSLDAKGVPGPEIRRRLQVIRGQFTEQPEGIEMIYDPLYGKPLTGALEKDGFKTQPNAFLVEAMKAIKSGGKALDVGAGMGRNAHPPSQPRLGRDRDRSLGQRLGGHAGQRRKGRI